MTSHRWVPACQPASGTVVLLILNFGKCLCPADLSPGRYEVFTGLYRSRDLERVPARDADGVAWLDGRVLLGNLIIE